MPPQEDCDWKPEEHQDREASGEDGEEQGEDECGLDHQ